MSITNAFHSEIMTQVIRKCALWVTGMHFSYDFTILNGYIKWSQQISLILVNGYSILSIPTYYTIIYGLAQFWEDDEHMGSMNIWDQWTYGIDEYRDVTKYQRIFTQWVLYPSSYNTENKTTSYLL